MANRRLTNDQFSDRLWDAAVRVGKVVDSLPDTKVGRHVAGQLVRCGTSSPPNYEEACAAESRRDFVHKLSIAQKELRETHGWLKFIVKAELLPETRLNDLIDEVSQLMALVAASIVTARNNARRSNKIDE